MGIMADLYNWNNNKRTDFVCDRVKAIKEK